jgi:ribosome-interacting GTPase 1
MTLHWRDEQRKMFDNLELEQDKRIKKYFAGSRHEGTLLYGDTAYFNDYFNQSQKYKNALLVFNEEIETRDFLDTIAGKISLHPEIEKLCIAVNKFCIYSETVYENIESDYDTALVSLVSGKLKGFKLLEHIYDTNLKGNKLNFASPYTQMYFEKWKQ